MAVTKTINGTTNSPNLWTYKLVATETATDTASRTSTIKVEHYLGRKKGAGSSYFSGSYSFSTTIAGTTKTSNKSMDSGTISSGGWKKIGEHTFNVSNVGNPTTIAISGTQTSGVFNPSSSSASGTMDLTILHLPPEITAITIEEIDPRLIALTLDDDIIVSNLSQKRFTITATTYDGATLTTYNVYYNNQLIGTSASNVVDCDFANVLVTTGDIKIEVIDDLQGKSYVTNTYSIIQYTKPIISSSSVIKRKTDINTDLTDEKGELTLYGNYYSEDDIIGNANTITTVEYKIWNTTEPSYTDITNQATIGTGDVTIYNYELPSTVEFEKIYYYKMVITDYFGNTSEVKEGKVPTALAVWTEYKDHVDFYELTKQNIPVIVPYSLFTDAVGSSSTIQLSDDISNYQFIEIYFYYAIDDYTLYSNYLKEYDADGKTITLSASYDNGTYLYHEVARYIASGTAMTKDTSARWRMATGGANSTRTDTTSSGSSLRINKVIGYK